MQTIKLMRHGESSMDIKINVDKLLLIQKALGQSIKSQVGVLGSSPHNRSVIKPRMATVRNAEGIGKASKKFGSNRTNAEIGADHEFGILTGSRKLPKRSFLWMPLSLYLFDAIQKKASEFNRLIAAADVIKCYAILGIVAENVVQSAFQTGGFGNWQALSQSTIEKKGSNKILIDTAQLRKSITSRVV